MSAPTPGPWVFSGWQVRTAGGVGKLVAELIVNPDGDGPLIAAAHETLAALESILTELGPMGDLYAYRNAPYFVAAQAASAKASS